MATALPKKPARDKTCDDFPDDVLIEIFLKLPVRSLFLFRSVSKNWFNLIQSPCFIDLHLNRPLNNHTNNNGPILIVRDIYPKSNRRKLVLTWLLPHENYKSLAYRNDVDLELLSPWIHSSNLLFNKGRLLGPCNGLFCLTDTVNMVIFNPATMQRREVLRLPPSPCDGRLLVGVSVPCFYRVCFGFDSVSRDYKVVGFRNIDEQQFKNDCDDDDVYSNIDKSDCDYNRVEIYSLSTNTWTQVNRVAPARDLPWLRNRNCDLFFNGAFHWFGCHSRVISSIVVFDLNKEDFKQFQLPDSFPTDDYLGTYLSVLDECFCIVVLGLFLLENQTQIWVMKEYGVHISWTKSYNIGVDWFINPLSCSKDGEFLWEENDWKLVFLNLNTSDINYFEVAPARGAAKFAFRYRESLVSPKRSKKCAWKQDI